MNRKDFLSRPIFIYDLETTDADVNSAKIVTMSMNIRNIAINGLDTKLNYTFNPGIPISPEATAVHGISDADVENEPPFSIVAKQIADFLQVEGMILCGYNNRMFDDIILERELADAGHPVNLFTMPCMDLYALWRAMEPRTLTGAVKRFLGEDMQNAHDAAADTDAVVKLLPAMAEQLGMPDGDINAALFPQQANWLDRQGKIVRNDDGEACLSFGKNAGVPITKLDRSYIEWMLKSDFPSDTLQVLRANLRA